MNRKSSVHFKPVNNVRFAVSHSERTDLSEPGYLLPKEHQLPNVVVGGSLSENDLAALFIQQKERMTGQAKARGSSPFWEGVVVLGNTDAKEQSANLLEWKKAYEQATGHRVLHMSIHLDEGYVDATGHPQYNPHAHVIVSRMDEKNRVIKLERKALAAVQDLTAEALKMERGSTLAERGGKRGRRHVGHREYRAQADENRLNLDGEKAKTAFEAKLTDSQSAAHKHTKTLLKEALAEASRVPALEAQVTQLKAEYSAEREALKASGIATQRDYQALKKAHEAALAKLKDRDFVIGNLLKNEAVLHEKVTTMTQENKALQDDLEVTKTRFAAMATAYQAEKAAGTPAHLIVPGTTKNPATLPSPSNTIPAQPVTPAPSKTPSEAPKPQIHTTPLPTSEKSLLERLEASMKVFLEWIKGKGGVVVDVDTQQSDHYGPVVQLDDLHAVQATGRGKHVVHQLTQLDRVPALNDSKTEIHYRNGVGQVKGRGLGKGGLGD